MLVAAVADAEREPERKPERLAVGLAQRAAFGLTEFVTVQCAVGIAQRVAKRKSECKPF